MRLEYPNRVERFGAVRIHELQQVIELDSGSLDDTDDTLVQGRMIQMVPQAAINQVEQRMAVVVPCKDERRKVIDGVLSGIPHDCLIILVSNSSRHPVDRFAIETQTVEQFCHAAERPAVLVHQRDPKLAAALAAAGAAEVLGEDGLVRHGKGEGMLVGVALAALTGRDFVGFVDADNYVPGAVHEYCKVFAAGLQLGSSPYSMVRISWQSKPKLQDGRLFFNRWGRTSQVTNRFLNLLLAEYSGFGTEIITTGNAGEHAMSMELATRMRLAGGFAVEPYEYLDLFEQFGGIVESPHPEVMRQSVDIFQVETRNPHFHDNKGSDHVQEMRLQALNVLYHSPICLPGVREEIIEFLREQGVLAEGAEPPQERVYPPVSSLDLGAFLTALEAEAESFVQVERRRPSGVQVDSPILRPGSHG
jgi:mannosyl-3-phosphoglycerate synthase